MTEIIKQNYDILIVYGVLCFVGTMPSKFPTSVQELWDWIHEALHVAACQLPPKYRVLPQENQTTKNTT